MSCGHAGGELGRREFEQTQSAPLVWCQNCWTRVPVAPACHCVPLCFGRRPERRSPESAACHRTMATLERLDEEEQRIHDLPSV